MWKPPERDKYVQLLLFDLPGEKEAINLDSLQQFENPKNDNERLFNLQYAYYHGDSHAIENMFFIMGRIAPRIVNIESKKRQLILSKSRMRDLGDEAVMIFIENVLDKNLIIKKSFIAYLRLQVLRALFYQTKSQKFEKWMAENNIDLFSMDEFGLEWAKESFERELEAERKERMEKMEC